MPISPTYPGVYVEEIPSGVRTIVGVATSITAFIGLAKKGPVNEATTINSYADYERIFGGLDLNSTMSFAARDFYLNGGSQAVIVRLFNDVGNLDVDIQAAQEVVKAIIDADPTTAAQEARSKADEIEARSGQSDSVKAVVKKVAKAAEDAAGMTGADSESVKKAAELAVPLPVKTRFDVDAVKLEASYNGAWGQGLRASIDFEGLEPRKKRINLTVRDIGTGGISERHLNLELEENSERNIEKILKENSKLVRMQQGWIDKFPEDFEWGSEIISNLNTKLQDAQGELSNDSDNEEKKKKVEQLTSQLAEAKSQDIYHDPITTAENELKAAKEADPNGNHQTLEDKLSAAIAGMAASDGNALKQSDFTGPGKETEKEGLYALEQVDLFNLLCIPPYEGQDNFGKPKDVELSLVAKANSYCEKRRAMLLVDSRSNWGNKADAKQGINDGVGAVSKNAALFFPRLKQPNPLRDNHVEEFVPCGAVAGVMARTDTQRGVWKAPAGIEATLRGVPELTVNLTDAENGELNPLGVNCLRSFPIIGRVVWGSRTLRGADILADEYKYIPVRRLALYIEESLYRGTHWVVFEPNDEPLWAQIRLNVGAFMNNLFRQGAFQGTTPKQAYFVKCDKETTTQNDIDRGIVNIVVGFAPLKPAEFVIIKLQQIAGDLEV